jgi:hypothetical protein
MTYPQITRGVSRNMQLGLPVSMGGFGVVEPRDVPMPQGGGNLNGSSAIHFHGGCVGCAGSKIAVPRKPPNSGNYCGTV